MDTRQTAIAISLLGYWDSLDSDMCASVDGAVDYVATDLETTLNSGDIAFISAELQAEIDRLRLNA
jgi:hypothetical protein